MKKAFVKTTTLTLLLIILTIIFVGFQPQVLFAEYDTVEYETNAVLAPSVDAIYTPKNGMIRYNIDEKCGFLNENFENVIPSEYDNMGYPASDFNEGAAIVRYNGYYGVIDKSGNVIIPFEYDSVHSSDNMYIVKKDGYEGIINKNGNMVLPLKYGYVRPFNNERAVVANKLIFPQSPLYGAVDENANLVVPMIYDSLDSFENNFAIVSKKDWSNERFGVIDKNGNVLIPMEYDEIKRAGNGVVLDRDIEGVHWDSFWSITNGTAVYIGEYYSINPYFCDGLTWVQQHDGKCGFIDTFGAVIIPLIYEDADIFSDGLACVKQNGKIGYINTTGEVVIPFEYEINGSALFYSRFTNSYAAVIKDGQSVIIDTSGAVAYPFFINSSSLDQLRNHGSTFVIKDGKYGMIDKNGSLVIDYLFSAVESFVDGYAFVIEPTDTGNRYGIVSQDGKITARYLDVRPSYSSQRISHSGNDSYTTTYTLSTTFHEGLAAVHIDGKWGYINTSGELVIDLQFDTATKDLGYGSGKESIPGGGPFRNGYAIVHISGAWNIIDIQGHFVLDCAYDSIQSLENYYICQSGNGALKILSKDCKVLVNAENGTVLDKNGNTILQYSDSVNLYYNNLFTYKLGNKTGVFAITENTVQRDDDITVYCNGSRIMFDQPPIVENDRVLVPMRFIFEALGTKVEWENETQTVTAAKDDIVIVLHIGSPEIIVNDEIITLDVAPQIINSRTLVPVRAISEGLNADVQWDETTRTVIISAYSN